MGLSDRGWADCKIKSVELPVTMVGSRAIATLGLNGTQAPLIVDTGAFFSTLTHAAAQQLQLKIGSLPWAMRIEGLTGEIESGMTTVKRVQLSDGEIPDVDFVVGGNDENTGGNMGLLGRNFLAFTDAEYDLAHGVIRLMFPNEDCRDKGMAYWAEAGQAVSEVDLLRDDRNGKNPAIQAVAQLNGKKLRVLFDSGAQSLLTLNAAQRIGLSDLKSAGKVHGAGRGEAQAWTALADSFEMGLEKTSNVRIRVADFQLKNIDMLLGVDFFLSHRLYISKKQRRMYFTYNGGPVFALSAMENARAARPANPANPAAGTAEAAEPAQAAAAAASADEPVDAAGFARRGAAAAARFDYTRALVDLDRACAMAPQAAEYFVRRGVVHEARQDRGAALTDFDQALQLDPAQAEALLHRAALRLAGRDRSGAREDVLTLDRTLPAQANQRLQLAAFFQRLDQPEQAIAQWDLWVPAHPHDLQMAGVLNNRCWARTLLNTGLDQALEDCERAIDLQDKNGSYYDSRAWLRLRRGELQKALPDFDRALKLKPDMAWALYGRGIARRKLGDAAAGQADIEAARKLLPSIDTQTGRHGLGAEPAAPATSGSAPTRG
ncbi:MAG: aspartyl protease family protein [Burkholderiaceae bacterium]